LRRVQSSHRRPDGPSGFCGDRQPSTSLGENGKSASRRFQFCSVGNDAIRHVAPQGYEQLAGQGDDYDLPDPPAHCADARAEPHGQGAVRLPAKLHPCEFDHRRAHPSVAFFSDPLLAFGAAAQNGVPPSPTYPPSARRLRNCRTNASRTRRVAMSGPIDRNAVSERIILSASSAGASFPERRHAPIPPVQSASETRSSRSSSRSIRAFAF
jgi:hypothetical protein